MTMWKAIPGFEGFYEVSDAGCVRSIRTDILLRPYLRGGYRSVSLKLAGKVKIRSVHTLVLEAFSGRRPTGLFGAHLDGNRENNAANNLAWVSQAENEAHKTLHERDCRGERSHHSKLTNEQADLVREIAAIGISQTKIARLLGMAESSISRIILGRRY